MTEAQTLFFGAATGGLVLLGIGLVIKSVLSKGGQPHSVERPRHRPF
jgi:hypothetical protein